MLKKAFTLIELLVVIGIMAVLAAGVIALIDPLEKTRQANDSNVINAIGQIATAMQSSAAQDTNGMYPDPDTTGGLVPTYQVFVTNGELKAAPYLPGATGTAVSSTYTMTYGVNASNDEAFVQVNLLSKKYTSKCDPTVANDTAYWFYSSANGRACGTCAPAATPPIETTGCGVASMAGMSW